jgi:N-acetylmuramoyl-L-alanine amidase
MKTIIIDPGHGMSNRQPGVYDSGATSSGHSEAATGHPIAARALETIAAEATRHVTKATVISAVASALSEAAFAGGK